MVLHSWMSSEEKSSENKRGTRENPCESFFLLVPCSMLGLRFRSTLSAVEVIGWAQFEKAFVPIEGVD